jgi:hypothetical protein
MNAAVWTYIVCLWAPREFREWSLRLANPLQRPFARRVCELVSENRHTLSAWFSEETPERLRERLAALPDEEAVGYCKAR